MNIRIKELAEQAGEYVNEVYTPPVRSKTPGKIWEDGHIEWHTQFNQKFAELIILECAKSANDWYQNHDKIHSDPMSYVLAHFGVEE